MKTNSELIQMLELTKKDIKIVIITVFYMFKKLSRVMEDYGNYTNQISKVITTVCEVTYTERH